MSDSSALPKRPPVSWYYARHKIYELRRFIPFSRNRHHLEKMVGPYGYWNELRQFQFGFLVRNGLQPSHSLLDIGCGPLQGGLEFIRYLDPGNYAGIDIRSEPIQAAYLRVAKSGLVAKNPLLAVSTSFGRDELGDRVFDYFWASQVLYHLNDDDLHACLEQVSTRMKPSSVLYGNVIPRPDFHRTWGQWEGFPFFPRPVDEIRDVAARYGLSVSVIGNMREFGYPEAGDLHLFSMLEFRNSER